MDASTQAEMDDAAQSLVLEFGTTAGAYVKTTTGAYNPATGEAVATDTSVPISVVLLDLTSNSSGLSVKYNTLIKVGDKEAYVIPPAKFGGPALTIDPVNDSIVVSGVSYSIVTFKEVNTTGSTPILYTFYLRR